LEVEVIKIHDVAQGSEEWIAARCGLLTASEMSRIITPTTLKPAANDKATAHLYELLAQRITRYVEPTFISDDMMRGNLDEVDARALYAKHYAPVQEVGFVTNDKWGFTIGYSPDGFVGDDGLIECKSRRQKFQVEIIVNHKTDPAHMIQIQTALLVTGREWLDYVSYSGGLPLFVLRAYPDNKIMEAILAAAEHFETALTNRADDYKCALAHFAKMIPTERRVEQEMFI
jgi:hypothetical protein